MNDELNWCVRCGDSYATVHSYCGDCYFARLAETFNKPIEAAAALLTAQLEPMKKLSVILDGFGVTIRPTDGALKQEQRLKVYKAYRDGYPIGTGGVLRSWQGNKLKGKLWTGKGALKAAFACWAKDLDSIEVEEYELVLKRRVSAREIVEE